MSTITLEYHQMMDDKVIKKELSFSEELLTSPYALASLFVIQVEGRSMQPLIKDKALVIADLSQKVFEEEGIFLVDYENKMWIKKASMVEDKKCFVSINPEFSHLVYEAKEVAIIAKAILTFTNL
ncbi:S24 family peptidase [Candidatus Marinarcus aquaticus]|uniref:Peptidase n=1 Tax=Candidatus Marinarcus aquaticus TaxID=2044504 RepID=A0A4Q0XVQ0_9BACT|nr:S24 family peptidase [Candidatus Marinarcus aquaticus]RXJ59941.1 peptidase [Candidatus Marinarcus aquaticus]